jgi:hypothetical protein
MITHFNNVLKVAGIAMLMISCGRQREKDSHTIADTTSTADTFTSSAARNNPADTIHAFVRTADVKFKVSNVVNATYAIENIVGNNGGFVTLSQVASNIYNVESTPISSDSSIHISHYNVSGNIIIRVPNTQLDTTLKEIAKLVDFVDYRTIKASDVSMQLKANKLLQQRYEQHGKRLVTAIDDKGRKLPDVANAEENLLNKQAVADNALVETATLNDMIAYSTITLQIYQDNAVRIERSASEKIIAAYTAPVNERVAKAFNSGWVLVKECFIALVYIWPLIIALALSYVLYKRLYLKKSIAG